MYEFKLPDIGEGLSEAELLEWTVKIGDRVKEGDEVAMISTDKVNVDLTAPATGVVTELIGEPGDVIDVGTLIMRIDDGGGAQASPDIKADASEEKAAVAAPEDRRESKGAAARVKAAPIVRRHAAEQGVDLSLISGTGPGGQVLRRDVDAFLAAGREQAEKPLEGKRMKLSGPRLAAAQRLAEGYRNQVTTTIDFEVCADALLESLRQLSGKANENTVRLTPTALVASCLVAALGKHAHFNATISENDNELLMHDHVNLGLAVNTGEGLKVPVIRGLEKMSVQEIAGEVVRKAELARSGALGLEDVRDSTFTLSSTGSLEQATITATTPIINYPNVATLWFSRITERPRPRVVDGNLEAGPIMNCSLSFDHRFLHGADGMAFINDIEKAFQNPVQVLM
jgi:pyruvate/2-oxoglutarate dehydrogenase complex dihydrolipoamide acyltransferase (E2) component